jgi:plasmid maintenance system antidote protein VapI
LIIIEVQNGKERDRWTAEAADTAIRLGKCFGTSAEFWIGHQTDYDLEESRREIESDIDLIPTHSGFIIRDFLGVFLLL